MSLAHRIVYLLCLPMRPLVMIPGPIEIDDAVVRTLGRPPKSHLDPEFIESFGRALERMRQVFEAPKGQPFIVAGSGTLAMEMAIANLVEPGDRAVVAEIGYFGARMADILERHGATVTRVSGEPGAVRPTADVAGALSGCKLLAITHVDTSTAVRNDVRALAALGREHGALVVVDGVCSVGGEVLLQDAWGVDVALTAFVSNGSSTVSSSMQRRSTLCPSGVSRALRTDGFSFTVSDGITTLAWACGPTRWKPARVMKSRTAAS
jgi:aspartate aminotransferase-like enzyme